MDERLERFAETNPGFPQLMERYRKVIADPEVWTRLRWEASARMAQAGMEKAAELRGEKRGEERGEKRGEERSDRKWESVVAGKDAEIASKDAEISRLKELLKK